MLGLKNVLVLFKKLLKDVHHQNKGVSQELSIRETEDLTQEQEEEKFLA